MSQTRKIVKIEVVATFEGDYYDAAECPGRLEYWIDGGFEDRDNLRGWSVHHISTEETPLDDAEDEAA